MLVLLFEQFSFFSKTVFARKKVNQTKNVDFLILVKSSTHTHTLKLSTFQEAFPAKFTTGQTKAGSMSVRLIETLVCKLNQELAFQDRIKVSLEFGVLFCSKACTLSWPSKDLEFFMFNIFFKEFIVYYMCTEVPLKSRHCLNYWIQVKTRSRENQWTTWIALLTFQIVTII